MGEMAHQWFNARILKSSLVDVKKKTHTTKARKADEPRNINRHSKVFSLPYT